MTRRKDRFFAGILIACSLALMASLSIPEQARVIVLQMEETNASAVPREVLEAIYEQRTAPLAVLAWEASDIDREVATQIHLGSLMLDGRFRIRHREDRWNAEVLAIGALFGCTEFNGHQILWAWTAGERRT